MSKLVFKLSDKRSVTIGAPAFTSQSLIFHVLGFLNKAFLAGFMLMFALGIFKDSYTTVDYFKVILVFVVLSGMVQIIKAIIGGFSHIPESKFDLFSLILLIGLISGLLIKQVTDITNEGMFPSQVYWFVTIWGILLFVLMHYFVDIGTRSRNFIIALLSMFLVLFEVGIVYELIQEQSINEYLAVLVVVLVPVFYGMSSLVKNLRVRSALVLNAILLAILGLIDLPASFAVIVFVVSLLFMVPKFLNKEIGIKDFKELLNLRLSNYKRMNLPWQNLLMVGLLLVLFVGIVISLITGADLNILKNGMELNYDVVKDTENIGNLLIGGNLQFFRDTISANIFRSYGLTGVVLIYGFLYYGAYAAYKFSRTAERDGTLLRNIAIALVIVPLFSIIVVVPMELLIIHFMLMGVVAAFFAVKKRRDSKVREAKLEIVKLDKNLDQRVFYGIRILQVALTVLTIIFGFYVVFNIDKIFLS